MDYNQFNQLFPLTEKCKSVKEENDDADDKKVKVKKSDVVELNPVIGSEK